MFKGFRDFVLRGNVVDLAVGVVIGAAFGAVVTAFVKDLLTPLIAAIAGKPDFSAYSAPAERRQVPLWRLFQRADFVSAGRGCCVLLCRASGEQIDGAIPEEGAARQDEMPAMPERHSGWRAQVRVLYGRALKNTYFGTRNSRKRIDSRGRLHFRSMT